MTDIIQATSDLFATVPGVPSVGGVAMNAPPAAILADVSRMVTEAVAALPARSRGALVAIATQDADGTVNVNMAFAAKAGAHVTILGWVGRRWGSPVSGGAAVEWVW
jgi:hypothetical protein